MLELELYREIENQAEVVRSLQDDLREDVVSYIRKHIFKKSVVGICWEQYTPFFNDGDPLEFEICFEDMTYHTKWVLDQFTIEDIQAKFKNISDNYRETLYQAFGDHVQVTIGEDHVRINKISHD